MPPAEYIEAVRAGLIDEAKTGIIWGFPATDFVATLFDAKYHDIDSSRETFEIAARQCFREGMLRAGPVLLEPLISIAVIAPQDLIGDVVGALNRRHGWIFGQVPVGREIILAVSLGLSAIGRFRDDLELSTQGRGSLTVAAEPYDYSVVRDMDDPDPTFPGAIGARAVA